MNDEDKKGKEFLREKYFDSFDTDAQPYLPPEYYCNDDAHLASNNLASSNNNLVNYANASVFNRTPNEQDFDYYNTNPRIYHHNNYYNVTQLTNDHHFPTNSRSANTTMKSQNRHVGRPSPILGPHIPLPLLGPHTPVTGDKGDDPMIILSICQRLGHNIDSAPPMPKNRSYIIQGDRKVGFPQERRFRNEHIDLQTGTKFMPNEIVKVIGSSAEPPRGRLRVEYQNHIIDVPHYQFYSLSESI